MKQAADIACFLLSGYQATADEVSNTDPFIMVITSVEHFVNASCFGTASFCLKVAVSKRAYNLGRGDESWFERDNETAYIHSVLKNENPDVG
jgi:hypothetical protein